MAQDRVNLKEEDLKKVLAALSKECPGSLVTIVIDHPKVTFISEDNRQNKVEIILRDSEYYMLPVRVKQEPL